MAVSSAFLNLGFFLIFLHQLKIAFQAILSLPIKTAILRLGTNAHRPRNHFNFYGSNASNRPA
jgi:hypothetical protein